MAEVGLRGQLEAGQSLVAHAEEFFYAFFPPPAGEDPNAAPDEDGIDAAIDLLRRHGTTVVADLVTYGTITGVFKNQVDWLPLEDGSVRPTQGRTLAVMQVCGGSQSFNVVNTLRVLGRWMRMVTIPNQSSVAKAWQEFDEAGRMRASPFYDRVVDVMEELVKFTLLVRGRSDYLVDRYSERKGANEARRVARESGVLEDVPAAS